MQRSSLVTSNRTVRLILWPILFSLAATEAHAQADGGWRSDLSASRVVPPVESMLTADLDIAFCRESGETDCYSPCPKGPLTDVPYEMWYRFPPRILRPLRFEIRRGPVGVNGTLVASLPIDGRFPEGTTTGVAAFPEDACPLAVADSLYILVITDAYPEGEARGQIVRWWTNPAKRLSWGEIKARHR